MPQWVFGYIPPDVLPCMLDDKDPPSDINMITISQSSLVKAYVVVIVVNV